MVFEVPVRDIPSASSTLQDSIEPEQHFFRSPNAPPSASPPAALRRPQTNASKTEPTPKPKSAKP